MTHMNDLSRRALLVSIVAASGARLAAPAVAQTDTPPAAPAPAPFGYQDVVKRARDLAAAPFDSSIPPLPDGLAALDFDGWRDIRFKSDKPLLGQEGANFRLELFHLGHLYKRPVVVNLMRDGIPAPIPYAANLFDYGHTKLGALPINLGFAGLRLRFPINAPHVWDEVIAFLGTSYFRFLGRGQRYGQSARGLAIGAAPRLNEEFPFFREFWIDTPDATAEHVVIYALLDGEFGDRRLPVRSEPRAGDFHRRKRHSVCTQGDAGARSCAPVVDVFRWQGRPAVRRRLPRRIARFSMVFSCTPARGNGSGGR